MTAWQIVHLRDVAKIERSGISPAEIENGTLYVGLEHIETGGRLLDIKPVANGDLASNKFSFTQKHVLFGKLRPYLAKIAVPDFSGVCSTDILPILPGTKLDRSYLKHFLRQQRMVDYAASRSTGANLPRLSPNALADFEIPLPPLDEQRRIAAILDAADSLRSKRRAALAKLDQLAQSIFIEMFGNGGRERTSYDVRPLADLCDLITDGTHKTPVYVESGVPFATVKNIVSGKLDLSDTKFITQEEHEEISRRARPEFGDVLVSKDGTIGVPCLVDTEEIFSIFVSVALLKPKRTRIDPKFLCNQIATSVVQRQIKAGTKGIAIRHLHLVDFRRLQMIVPPMALQREFSKRIEAIGRIRGKLHDGTTRLDQLFASLQHRAFRGEL